MHSQQNARQCWTTISTGKVPSSRHTLCRSTGGGTRGLGPPYELAANGARMMSNVALAPSADGRPAINAWFVAAAVIIPTFMEVLDTTVAIVSLRYIAGELSAAVVDAEWVLTSYLAANAT